MIIVESLPFIGWFFFLVFPVMAYIEFFKAIKYTINKYKTDRFIRHIDEQWAESNKVKDLIEQEIAEIRRLQEASDNCSDKEERQILLNRLYSLLDSK